MKTTISTTYDDLYLFFLPLCCWCWNKLVVDVVCFVPFGSFTGKFKLVTETIIKHRQSDSNCITYFSASEDKKATYSQCSRLYAASLDLPEDEVLITADVDMLTFGDYLNQYDGNVQLFGADLLEGEQMYPLCYCSATVKQWREFMRIGRSYQQELDKVLGSIECENMRGNYWCKDQELLFERLNQSKLPVTKHNRAKQPERFATNRIDRDDQFWEQRLSPNIIDYHCHRPGYTDENFEKILTVIQYFYPNEDLTWMKEYQQQYKKLMYE